MRVLVWSKPQDWTKGVQSKRGGKDEGGNSLMGKVGDQGRKNCEKYKGRNLSNRIAAEEVPTEIKYGSDRGLPRQGGADLVGEGGQLISYEEKDWHVELTRTRLHIK